MDSHRCSDDRAVGWAGVAGPGRRGARRSGDGAGDGWALCWIIGLALLVWQLFREWTGAEEPPVRLDLNERREEESAPGGFGTSAKDRRG